jgi:hypothetical protein
MLRRTFIKAASAVPCGLLGVAAKAQVVRRLPLPRPLAPRPPSGGQFCQSGASGFRSGGSSPQSYSFFGNGRRKTQLTYSVNASVAGVSNVAAVATQACSVWSAVTPALSFTQVSSGADIAIGVGSLGAGILGLTAPSGATITLGNATTYTQALLLQVLTHEIGHALGLGHDTVQAAMMYPFSSGQTALADDDISVIRALYGWSQQRQIPGIGTEQVPALCACGGTLAMAWRGTGDDHNIYFAISTDGVNWTPQRTIPGAATVASPSLTWDGTRIWMVWRGTGDDQTLYWAASTDFFQRNTTGVIQISGSGSSHGPRAAFIGGRIYMAWKGVGNDDALYFSSTTFGTNWLAQTRIGGVGSAAAPAICQDVTGVPRMVWRGTGNDHSLWTSTLTGIFWQPQVNVTWIVAGNGGAGTVSTGTPGSLDGPCLTFANNKVMAIWRGVDGDQGLYYNQLANDVVGGQTVPEWSAQAPIPNVGSDSGAVIAEFGGVLRAVWKGVQGDAGIYTAAV